MEKISSNKILLSFAIVLSFIFLCLCKTGAQEKIFTSLNESTRIVFTSERTGNLEIYSAKPDGSDIRQLTDNAAKDWEPDWSPDIGNCLP